MRLFYALFLIVIIHTRGTSQSMMLGRDTLVNFFIQNKYTAPKNNFFSASCNKAFFCRLEDKMQNKTKINFSFRLGSKEYTDRMEYYPYRK